MENYLLLFIVGSLFIGYFIWTRIDRKKQKVKEEQKRKEIEALIKQSTWKKDDSYSSGSGSGISGYTGYTGSCDPCNKGTTGYTDKGWGTTGTDYPGISGRHRYI